MGICILMHVPRNCPEDWLFPSAGQGLSQANVMGSNSEPCALWNHAANRSGKDDV